MLAAFMRRRYGHTAARRFAATAAACLLAQQILAGLVLWRRITFRHDPAGPRVGVVDAITFTRGGAGAALLGLIASGVRDRWGPAGWMGWVTLVYGAILSDWLDGPLARRLGTGPAGRIFDLEADSWLTLCTASAATALGGLPSYAIAGPVGRYLLLLAALRRSTYARFTSGGTLWERHIGMAQMVLYIAALAPFSGRLTRAAIRIATPAVVLSQLGNLLVQYRRHGRDERS